MQSRSLALAHSYDIACEPYDSAIEEGKQFLHEHWEELALYKDIPLDPEFEVYESLADKGMLALYTVRSAGEMVGYAVYFIRRHHHYKNSKWAISDIILVRKAYRNFGLGTALFDFIEDDLRKRNVDVMHTMTKVMHPELAMLLESRRHEKAEVSYSLRL